MAMPTQRKPDPQVQPGLESDFTLSPSPKVLNILNPLLSSQTFCHLASGLILEWQTQHLSFILDKFERLSSSMYSFDKKDLLNVF